MCPIHSYSHVARIRGIGIRRARIEQLESRQMLTSIQMVADYNEHVEKLPISNLTELGGDAYFSFRNTAEIWKLTGGIGEPEFVAEFGDIGEISYMCQLNDRLVFGIAGSDWFQLGTFDPASGTETILLSAGSQAIATNFSSQHEVLTFHFTDWFTTANVVTDGTHEGTVWWNNHERSLDLPAQRIRETDQGLFAAIQTEQPEALDLQFVSRGQQDAERIGSVSLASEFPDETSFGVWGNELLFPSESPDGHELWRADGTELGTRQLADLNPGPASSDPNGFTPVEESTYFIANDGEHRQLWELDADGNLRRQTSVDGDVLSYSVAQPNTTRDGLFVHTTDTGFALSRLATGQKLLESSQEISLVGTGSSRVFAVTVGTSGPSSLYTWSGQSLDLLTSQPGTFRMLADTTLGQYFELRSPDDSHSLWHTKGTPETTNPIERIGVTRQAIDINDALLFVDAKGNLHRGTDGEIATVANYQNRTASSHIQSANPVNGSAVFVVTHQPIGIYTTIAAPLLVSQGRTLDPLATEHMWYPMYLPVESTFFPYQDATTSGYYFATRAAEDQVELWRTDLTRHGTQRLEATEIAELLPAANLNDFFFDLEAELAKVLERPPIMPPLLVGYQGEQHVGAKLAGFTYFIDRTEEPNRLMRSTRSGDSEVVAEIPLVTSRGQNLIAFDHKLFFVADDGIHGEELWQFDGQAVTLARDIRPGKAGSVPQLLTVAESAIFYSANDGDHGREIWSVTAAVDSLMGDLNGDDEVGFADFLILSKNFGLPGDATDGDLDQDGNVTFEDFLLLAANFGEHR